MLFNSVEFAIFLPIVFFLYWFVFNNSLKIQNSLLLIASFLFYGWWDWRFLSLLVFSAMVDYIVGIALSYQNAQYKRKLLLGVSIILNIGLLGFFKYYNFFIKNFQDAFTFLGRPIQITGLSIVLPVGISFYTFQSLSYGIDIYRRKLEPTKDLVAFLTFVSFFPQLVAGPIERATNLLPQFYRKREFDHAKAVDGMRQILWGLFKKIVIADNCALFVNDCFANYTNYSGGTLLLGAVLFAFQIYCDFSGYSDIAIGSARLFGFGLMRNFAFPYFSRDIAEFWRRWHISLSTWFRDYVYIPLGGNRGDVLFRSRNILILFITSGFWHGANWTFISWGVLNALYFLPVMFLNRNRQNMDHVSQGRLIPSLQEALQILLTFCLTVVAWIFFRAQSVSQAMDYLYRMFARVESSHSLLPRTSTLVFILVLLMLEWIQREKQHALEFSGASMPIRWTTYYAIVSALYLFGAPQQDFIYFQF